MKKYLQSIIEKIKKRYRHFRQKMHNRAVIQKWAKAGHPYPPPHEYKQETLKQYALAYNFDTFIEAGTDLGKMPWELQDNFKKIYTIELNIDKYLNAKERFHFIEHIDTIKGESSEQLGLLLKSIRFPTLFWLDTNDHLEKGLAEFSIMKEIKTILDTDYPHVLLIPDARLFNGQRGYPSLIEIRNYISELRPDYHFEVENDIIRSFEEKSEKWPTQNVLTS